VKVGSIEKSFVMAADGKLKAYTLSFSDVRDVEMIEVIAPVPISPAEFTKGVSADSRKLAISFVGIKIMPAKSNRNGGSKSHDLKR
jgi:hypothetical protein